MHRSGTSLVARLFHKAGANMGDPDTFYSADRWNPMGYFEQKDIQKLNISLVNGPWWKFTYFWLPGTKTILRRGEKLAPSIKALCRKYEGLVVKENRFCLTLPAWQTYGDLKPRLLICLRSPWSVARSLQKRNKITVNRGYRLWVQHNQRLLENCRGLDTWIVRYDHLLDQRTRLEELNAAFNFFGLELDEAKLAQLADENISLKLNNNPVGQKACPPTIDELWQSLITRHAAQSA
jgi:hypothetical protein